MLSNFRIILPDLGRFQCHVSFTFLGFVSIQETFEFHLYSSIFPSIVKNEMNVPIEHNTSIIYHYSFVLHHLTIRAWLLRTVQTKKIFIAIIF